MWASECLCVCVCVCEGSFQGKNWRKITAMYLVPVSLGEFNDEKN